MLINSQIAETLRQVAAVFEVKDNDFFRARAYQNAANSIENLTIEAHSLWEQERLTEIPGVGEAIASHLAEWFKTGKVRHFAHELKRVPGGMFSLMTIRGVGPKTAFKIAQKYNLRDEKTALDKVRKMSSEGKLKGFLDLDAKLKKKAETSNRLLLSEAISIAQSFLEFIRQIESVAEAEFLGSLRRHCATIGDIDLGIATNHPKETLSKVLKYSQISDVFSRGPSVTRVKLKSGHEADIKICYPNEWGSLLQHYTGSKLQSYLINNGTVRAPATNGKMGLK